MSGEVFENDVAGTLAYGEQNYLAQIHDVLNHCPKHGVHSEIAAIGFGKLTFESEYAFRLQFQQPQAATTYDANHKKPDMSLAVVHHPESKPTINIGQPRMTFLLGQCGAPNPSDLVAKAVQQYNKVTSVQAHASHHVVATPTPVAASASHHVVATPTPVAASAATASAPIYHHAAHGDAYAMQQTHYVLQHAEAVQQLTYATQQLAVQPSWGYVCSHGHGITELIFSCHAASVAFQRYIPLNALTPISCQAYATGQYGVTYKI
jgi:hypothetical protein